VDKVKIGDKVLTVSSNGTAAFADVVMFFDAEDTGPNQYLQFELDNGHKVEMTPGHKVYAGASCCGHSSLVAAESLTLGSQLHVVGAGQQSPTSATVTGIRNITKQGKYDFATTNGDAVVVNGVVVSFLTTCPFRYCASGMPEAELDQIRVSMVSLFTEIYQMDRTLAEDLAAYYRQEDFKNWRPVAQHLTTILTKCHRSGATDTCNHSYIVGQLGDSVGSMPHDLKHRLVSALAKKNSGAVGASSVSMASVFMSESELDRYEGSLITSALASQLESTITAQERSFFEDGATGGLPGGSLPTGPEAAEPAYTSADGATGVVWGGPWN